MAEARAAAEADGKPGWKLTLRMPCYLPGDELRRQSRASRDDAPRLSRRALRTWAPTPRGTTAPVIRRILLLRREAAQLLGYPNFAALSLVPKMAKSVDEVLSFLRDLARRAKPFAERDYAELKAFAAAELGLADLAAVGPCVRVGEAEGPERFAFSEQEVRRYFPEGKVLAGLFRVAETLYGISIRRERGADVAPGRAVLRRRRRLRRADRPVLPRQLCASRESRAGRGRTTPSTAAAPARMCSIRFRTSPAISRRPTGDGPRDVHARRSHHALPRVRPRAAPASDARGGRRASPASRASNGMPSSFPASSWKISAGSGTCCRR